MEAVAADPRGLDTAGGSADLGDAGHVAMERGVEARDLRQVGIALAERLDQLDLARHVVRVVRADLRRSSINSGVTVRADSGESPRGRRDGRPPRYPRTRRNVEPVDHQADGRFLVGASTRRSTL